MSTQKICSVLGIDPGIHTGIARYIDGVLVGLETRMPWEMREMLVSYAPAIVVFEDSRQQSHTWTRIASREASLKMARNVGEIDAWCRLIEAECEALGIKCIGVSPRVKGIKIGGPDFDELTGWNGRSNQHTRDAAMCAWPYRRARNA